MNKRIKGNRSLRLMGIVFLLCMMIGCTQTQPVQQTEAVQPAVQTQTENTTAEGTEQTEERITAQTVEGAYTLPEYGAGRFDAAQIPSYTGSPYCVVNDNIPYFTDADKTDTSFEQYSETDIYGRCGVAFANIGTDLMPTGERGSLSGVKPTGWHSVEYDCVEGSYLYNKCHLIGYQLTGENANARNLITGTRYLNIEGMLPFENMVADYVKETENHVLYRVTPIFAGTNLVADGVLMEGYSVEDNGEGICFCIYAYNVQPGIAIDYATGESSLAQQAVNVMQPETQTEQPAEASAQGEYVINTNTGKFHLPGCASVAQIKAANREDYTGSREDLINRGYDPCKRCNP